MRRAKLGKLPALPLSSSQYQRKEKPQHLAPENRIERTGGTPTDSVRINILNEMNFYIWLSFINRRHPANCQPDSRSCFIYFSRHSRVSIWPISLSTEDRDNKMNAKEQAANTERCEEYVHGRLGVWKS